MIVNGPGISFTEPDIGSEFVPPIPENPRPKIVALCEHCTNRLLGRKELKPFEYWAFAEVTTDEMADVLLKMKMRRPYTLADAVKATGMDEVALEKLLDEMSYIGLLEYNWENPTRTKQWVLPMLVPGSAEFLNMRQSQIDEHPAVAKFFEQASKGALAKATPMVPPGGAGIGMHVIPVEQAIQMEDRSVSIEHIEHWLDKYEGKYAASPCSCRMSRAKLGEGCGDDPNDWCIAVGDMADYVVETDRGHYITREEVYETLRQAEANGFVHQITNIDGEDKIFAICNCNVNVCYALRTSQLFNTPNLSRSAYVARTEADKCVACGRCVEVCPAGAVKLGQKLCAASTGKVPEYPKQELPDAVKWGPEKWSPDYRNKNRIETYDTGTSPCKTACPAHIAVQGYLKLAAQGRYRDALALIKRENPLPAICGRICNRRCEDACTRGRIDAAVAIDEVKKFIAQQDLVAENRYVPEVVTPTRAGGFDDKIAVIGAGPAGLSCAFYLAEKGYKPVIFEKSARPGGMLTYGIPSYKLEKDVIEAEVEIIREMGVDIRLGVEVGRDVTLDELREQVDGISFGDRIEIQLHTGIVLYQAAVFDAHLLTAHERKDRIDVRVLLRLFPGEAPRLDERFDGHVVTAVAQRADAVGQAEVEGDMAVDAVGLVAVQAAQQRRRVEDRHRGLGLPVERHDGGVELLRRSALHVGHHVQRRAEHRPVDGRIGNLAAAAPQEGCAHRREECENKRLYHNVDLFCRKNSIFRSLRR